MVLIESHQYLKVKFPKLSYQVFARFSESICLDQLTVMTPEKLVNPQLCDFCQPSLVNFI